MKLIELRRVNRKSGMSHLRVKVLNSINRCFLKKDECEVLSNVSPQRWMRLVASMSLAVTFTALQGCAVPGFGFTSVPEDPISDLSRSRVLGYRPVVEPAPVEVTGEATLTKISPDLIQKQLAGAVRQIPDEVKSLFGVPSLYKIGPSDVIGIIVYDHPELLPNSGAVISQSADPTGVSVAPGFIVDQNGLVNFPYIGKVNVGGLSEIEASDLITSKISKYIRDPQVTVRIQSFRSKRAYVEGEVRTPGLQIFTDVPMTLAEAISRAGGITANGDRSFVTLTRGEKTTSIDIPQLQSLGADASNIPLRSGDVINVRNREESKVYVMGEILKPSALLMRNGHLSLNEAIGEAGGPNLTTSNPGQIYVIRSSPLGIPNIYHLDAKNPAAFALAEKFQLEKKDVVYIDPVPLVMWNRIVSLILPSAQVVNVGSQVVTR